MAWPLKRRQIDPAVAAEKERERAEADERRRLEHADREAQRQQAATAQERERAEAAERRRQERVAREARSQQAAARRRQVAGELAAAALSWGMTAWLEGAMWVCLAGGLAVDYIGSYADLAATFGAFGYADPVRWIMPLGIDLPVTASVLGQLLAGRWKCGWWVRVRLGILTAVTAPLTLVGNALRGAIDGNGHFAAGFHVALWMDLAAFAVPGLGVVLIGWVASMMQGERAELTRRRLEAEAEARAAAQVAAVPEPAREHGDAPPASVSEQASGSTPPAPPAGRPTGAWGTAADAREQSDGRPASDGQPAGEGARERARGRAREQKPGMPPAGAGALAPGTAASNGQAAANGAREQAPELSAGTSTEPLQPPPDDRPRGGGRAGRNGARERARGHARERTARVPHGEVRDMVQDAHQLLASTGDRPTPDVIAEHLTARGHPISASRVRTYLAELRSEALLGPVSSARRPRVLSSPAGLAAAGGEA